MDDVLKAALSLDNVGEFLHEGDYVIDAIFDVPGQEAGTPVGVN
jgi:hypothetical protein